eukprot:CAMPEP_0183469946 /NCGR_PEP_ID=MMETSP0370-20130417/155367_1 /TAXON_ID=268820 /ORGANISM="Peridinium aciculiferum, Strain PAER-2" /LENGTH=35 /DNA_ID= /DNA_START= /DNA_END= /DNA_ORIENTATION=
MTPRVPNRSRCATKPAVATRNRGRSLLVQMPQPHL